MPDVFFQEVFAEQDGQQDTDSGADEKEKMGIIALDIEDQFTDAVGQFLDDDSSCSGKETRRDAEQNHETTVGHVRCPPCVELVNPSVKLIFEHGFSCFKAAKIGKSNAQRKKK